MTHALQLEHIYKPRGACKELFSSKDEEVLISGPAGTGKSRACMEKLHLICLRTPGVRALIVRKTLTSLGSTALVTWRLHVAKEAIATNTVVYYGGSQQEAAQYRYSNGSSVTIGGMDKPSRIMSSEYDIVYVQEATELNIEDVEAITSRLRNWKISFQQVIMDCNPAGDKHWLKLRCNEGKTKLLESRHEDNPILFDDENNLTERGRIYIGKLDRLTGVRKARLRYGLWVSSEGTIYEEFDSAIHILKWDYDDEGNKLPLPEEWDRYWVIDFGFVNPFVCQWWAEDEDGALYMYREIYMTQRTVAEHAKKIMEQVTKINKQEYYDHFNKEMKTIETIEWTEPTPRAIICDHDAEGRRTFEQETGLGTMAAIKWVSQGIDAVKERFKVNDEGYSRAYIMEDTLVERDQNLVDDVLPTCTVEEIPGYVWVVGSDGRRKEEPQKKDDHGMDDMRYIISWRDLKGKARVSQIEM
jgi:phage terminase large subunit